MRSRPWACRQTPIPPRCLPALSPRVSHRRRPSQSEAPPRCAPPHLFSRSVTCSTQHGSKLVVAVAAAGLQTHRAFVAPVVQPLISQMRVSTSHSCIYSTVVVGCNWTAWRLRGTMCTSPPAWSNCAGLGTESPRDVRNDSIAQGAGSISLTAEEGSAWLAGPASPRGHCSCFPSSRESLSNRPVPRGADTAMFI